MGLFDTVHCEYRLEDPRLQRESFQTKDLECGLESYTITADGRLLRHARSAAGAARLDRDVEWPIHGDILIYTSDPDRDRTLVDLVVRFTHGRVEWIRRREEGEDRRGAPPAQPWRLSGRWLDALPDAPLEEERDSDSNRAAPPAIVAPAGPPGPQVEDARGGDRGTERRLLENLRRDRDQLVALLESASDHWGFEDPVYRFYHQSLKVYAIQRTTEHIVQRLNALSPESELNPWFRGIAEAGTHLRFATEHNARWLDVTRPMLEAFFHARYFLEMAVRYSTLEEPPDPLPSGYAALLCLYGLR